MRGVGLPYIEGAVKSDIGRKRAVGLITEMNVGRTDYLLIIK